MDSTSATKSSRKKAASAATSGRKRKSGRDLEEENGEEPDEKNERVHHQQSQADLFQRKPGEKQQGKTDASRRQQTGVPIRYRNHHREKYRNDYFDARV